MGGTGTTPGPPEKRRRCRVSCATARSGRRPGKTEGRNDAELESKRNWLLRRLVLGLAVAAIVAPTARAKPRRGWQGAVRRRQRRADPGRRQGARARGGDLLVRGDDKVIPTDGWQYGQFAYRHAMQDYGTFATQLEDGQPVVTHGRPMGRQVPVAATGAEGDRMRQRPDRCGLRARRRAPGARSGALHGAHGPPGDDLGHGRQYKAGPSGGPLVLVLSGRSCAHSRPSSFLPSFSARPPAAARIRARRPLPCPARAPGRR